MSSKGQQIIQKLQFNKDDLTHNRNGELSPKQIEMLIKGGRTRAYRFGGLALLMTPLLLFAADDWGQFFFLQAINIGLFGLMAVGSVLVMNKDANEGLVESVVGSPSMKTKLKGRRIRKVFFLGEREFSDKWLYSLLNENGLYRAYYAPKSGKIVSIEPVKK